MILKISLKFTFIHMINFHPLEVVVRGCETQLQVGGHLNYLIQRVEGYLELYFNQSQASVSHVTL